VKLAAGLLTLAALTVGLLWAAGPAAAGAGPKVRVAKQKGGPYVPDRISVNVAKARDLYFRVTATADEPADATLMDQSGGIAVEDYNWTWFLGKENVDDDVQASAYEFRLKPGKPRLFRVRVKPKVPNPRAFCIHGAAGTSVGTNHGQFEMNGPSCI
jgi:hypothetical protein